MAQAQNEVHSDPCLLLCSPTPYQQLLSWICHRSSHYCVFRSLLCSPSCFPSPVLLLFSCLLSPLTFSEYKLGQASLRISQNQNPGWWFPAMPIPHQLPSCAVHTWNADPVAISSRCSSFLHWGPRTSTSSLSNAQPQVSNFTWGFISQNTSQSSLSQPHFNSPKDPWLPLSSSLSSRGHSLLTLCHRCVDQFLL